MDRNGPKNRDEAKAETREALLNAGIAEFAERGFDTPSLDSICERAGYTRGAFYVHFENRDDFLAAVMERIINAFMDAVIATGNEARDFARSVTRFAHLLEAIIQFKRAAQPGAGPTAFSDAEIQQWSPWFLQTYRVFEAAGRSPLVRQRMVALLEKAVDRLRTIIAAGQSAGTLRPEISVDALAFLLASTAVGILMMAELGSPVDTKAARDTILKILASTSADNESAK